MKVLDTSAILRTDLDFSNGDFLITNSVLDEIREEHARLAVESGVRSGNISIMDPSERYIRKVAAAAKDTGDLDRLSETDLEVLALALENNIPLASDDYAIQNVASCLGLDFERSSADGIKRTLKWVWVCEGCAREYDSQAMECPICGSGLKRRSIRL